MFSKYRLCKYGCGLYDTGVIYFPLTRSLGIFDEPSAPSAPTTDPAPDTMFTADPLSLTASSIQPQPQVINITNNDNDVASTIGNPFINMTPAEMKEAYTQLQRVPVVPR